MRELNAQLWWKSAAVFVTSCLLLVASIVWAANHFRDFAAVYDGSGMTGVVTKRTAGMAGGGASSTQIEAKFEDGTIRSVRMSADQWGTCYVGATLAAKEIDKVLFLTTDGCRPIKGSQE